MKRIRERATEGSVVVSRRTAVSLSGLTGERLVVRYHDAKLQESIVEDAVEFLRSGHGRERVPGYTFSACLRTPERFYKTDRNVFESLLRTIRFFEPKK